MNRLIIVVGIISYYSSILLVCTCNAVEEMDKPDRFTRINNGINTILNGVGSGNLENILRGSFMFTRNENVQSVANNVLDNIFQRRGQRETTQLNSSSSSLSGGGLPSSNISVNTDANNHHSHNLPVLTQTIDGNNNNNNNKGLTDAAVGQTQQVQGNQGQGQGQYPTSYPPEVINRVNNGVSTILGGVRRFSLEQILRGSFLFTRNENVRNVANNVIDSVFSGLRGEQSPQQQQQQPQVGQGGGDNNYKN